MIKAFDALPPHMAPLPPSTPPAENDAARTLAGPVVSVQGACTPGELLVQLEGYHEALRLLLQERRHLDTGIDVVRRRISNLRAKRKAGVRAGA